MTNFEAVGTLSECLDQIRKWGFLEEGDRVVWTLQALDTESHPDAYFNNNIYLCEIRKAEQ